jgi:hypothetical protein
MSLVVEGEESPPPSVGSSAMPLLLLLLPAWCVVVAIADASHPRSPVWGGPHPISPMSLAISTGSPGPGPCVLRPSAASFLLKPQRAVCFSLLGVSPLQAIADVGRCR